MELCHDPNCKHAAYGLHPADSPTADPVAFHVAEIVESYEPRTMTAGRFAELRAEQEKANRPRRVEVSPYDGIVIVGNVLNATVKDEPWNDPKRMEAWFLRSLNHKP